MHRRRIDCVRIYEDNGCEDHKECLYKYNEKGHSISHRNLMLFQINPLANCYFTLGRFKKIINQLTLAYNKVAKYCHDWYVYSHLFYKDEWLKEWKICKITINNNYSLGRYNNGVEERKLISVLGGSVKRFFSIFIFYETNPPASDNQAKTVLLKDLFLRRLPKKSRVTATLSWNWWVLDL